MPKDRSVQSLIYHLEKAIEELKKTEDVRTAYPYLLFAHNLSNLMLIRIERGEHA